MPRHRKLTIPARYRDYTIDITVRNIPRGVLVAPEGDWTDLPAHASSVNEQHLTIKNSGGIYQILFQNLAVLGSEPFPAPKVLERYASVCHSFTWPQVPARYIGHQIPADTLYIYDGVLAVPAKEWTGAASLAGFVEENHLLNKNSGDIFQILIQIFAALVGDFFPAPSPWRGMLLFATPLPCKRSSKRSICISVLNKKW